MAYIDRETSTPATALKTLESKTKGKPRGTKGGRKPKGDTALPKDQDYIMRPTHRQATYLGLAALAGLTKQDITRQALDEFIDRQTAS